LPIDGLSDLVGGLRRDILGGIDEIRRLILDRLGRGSRDVSRPILQVTTCGERLIGNTLGRAGRLLEAL
jgi:hypothetical protein